MCFSPGHILRRVYNYAETKKSRTFFKSFVRFLHFNQTTTHKLLQVQLHKQFLITFLSSFNQRFSQKFSVFTPLFHSRTSKFTTTTAQLPFYNCKLHFTTAEIVISCTLKYALLLTKSVCCLPVSQSPLPVGLRSAPFQN